MSTEKPAGPNLTPLTIRQIGELLIKHFGLTEGKFDVSVEFNVGTGLFGPSPNQSGPGIAIGLNKIGLTPAIAEGPNSLDASEINKSPKRARNKAK